MIIPIPKHNSIIAKWCRGSFYAFSDEAELMNSDPSSVHYASFVADASFYLAMEIDGRFGIESKKKCIDLLLLLACELELYKTATIKTPLFALKMQQLEKAFEF